MLLQNYSVICNLGINKKDILHRLLSSQGHSFLRSDFEVNQKKPYFGFCDIDNVLPMPDDLKVFQTRNNRILYHLASELIASTPWLKDIASERIGVVLGTSTSSIAETEQYLRQQRDTFSYLNQEISSITALCSQLFNATGPVLTLSTACSSSAKVFSLADTWLTADLCDVVIVGGIDSCCEMTIRGFSALEAVSSDICKPFDVNRDGITLGEGGALFVMSKQPFAGTACAEILAIGESSDAYHISSPDPAGVGAERAMLDALAKAGLGANQIDFLNLHGTGTPHNDAMESVATGNVFGTVASCSTKQFTGHTLGAAGAIELALSLLVFSKENTQRSLPYQHNIIQDTVFPEFGLLVQPSTYEAKDAYYIASNSFAFGGSNACLIAKC